MPGLPLIYPSGSSRLPSLSEAVSSFASARLSKSYQEQSYIQCNYEGMNSGTSSWSKAVNDCVRHSNSCSAQYASQEHCSSPSRESVSIKRDLAEFGEEVSQ